MAEKSYFWDGTTIGDATLAPVTDSVFHGTIWRNQLSRAANEGVVYGYLNNLEVTGVTGGIKIDTGAALVEGRYYESDAAVTMAIPSPVANPRYDYIVLQKNPASYTIRIFRIVGVEGAPPAEPTLTQVSMGQWETPLALVYIATTGTMTITDRREFCNHAMQPRVAMGKIAEVDASGLTEITFSDITNFYRHLQLIGNSAAKTGAGNVANVYFNNISDILYYGRQRLYCTSGAAIGASATLTSGWAMVAVDGAAWGGLHNAGFSMFIHNYKDRTFYKNAIKLENAGVAAAWGYLTAIEGIIFRETGPITSISLLPSSTTFLNNTIFSLYGYK